MSSETTNDLTDIRPDDSEINGLINFDNPVVKQVWNMDPFKYQRWVHTVKAPKHIKLFESKSLESLSVYPWWMIYLVWIPFIFHQMGSESFTPYQAVSAVVGLGIWIFVEYVLHRFVFHMKTNSRLSNMVHFLIHGIHHLTPNDSNRMTFPVHFSVIIGLLLWNICMSFQHVVPTMRFILIGFTEGYLLYDTIHAQIHLHPLAFSRIPTMKLLVKHHFKHHYKSVDRNFGVSAQMFDGLFGTLGKIKE